MPFKLKLVGAVTVPLWLPVKPKLDVPPFAPIVPFQKPAGFETVAFVPDWLKVAFQTSLIVSPLRKFQVNAYPCTALLAEFVMVTLAWNPLPHWFVIT